MFIYMYVYIHICVCLLYIHAELQIHIQVYVYMHKCMPTCASYAHINVRSWYVGLYFLLLMQMRARTARVSIHVYKCMCPTFMYTYVHFANRHARTHPGILIPNRSGLQVSGFVYFGVLRRAVKYNISVQGGGRRAGEVCCMQCGHVCDRRCGSSRLYTNRPNRCDMATLSNA